MSDDWIDILLSASYDANLPSLTLAREEPSAQFSGSGRLTWREDGGLRLHAQTDGGEQAIEAMRVAPTPGQLIPHGAYLTLSGDTQHGWHVCAERVLFDGFSAVAGSSLLAWDLPCRRLELTRSRAEEGTRAIDALMGPQPPAWVRSTETTVSNDWRSRRQTTYDWLQVETPSWSLAAFSRSDFWFEVQAVLRDDGLSAEDFLLAVRSAFSFALGRAVFIRGYEESGGGRPTRRLLFLPYRPPHHAAVAPPLGSGLDFREAIEGLLCRAISFFLTEDGMRVAQHLGLIWDTSNNTIQTRLAVTATTSEGLIRMAAKNAGAGGAPSVSDRRALETWVAANSPPNGTAISARFASRLRGSVGAWANVRPQDILRDWCTLGLLGVTNPDIDAWRELRNPAAHGGMIELEGDPQFQAILDRLLRVLNLMNRVTLQLMGYDGPYVDYTQPFWPAVQFPATPPGSL